MDIDLPAWIGAEDRAERAFDLGDDDEGIDEKEEDQEDISNDESAICRVETPKQPRVSEYEHIKQRNIAENKIILAKIRADHAAVVEGKEKGGKESMAMKKGKQTASRWDRVEPHMTSCLLIKTFFLHSTARRPLTRRQKRPATMPHQAPTPQ